MGPEVIIVMFILYFVVRNAVEAGINRSKLVVGNNEVREDDIT